MAQSLQIKRNKNIFRTKDDAVNHLNNLIDELKDGEIVLCRYFNGNTVQTLIGVETKYNTYNQETNENEIISSICYLDSFDEIGNGLFKDENGVLQIKIDDKDVNFLTLSENGLKVSNMHANATITTEDIIAVGGPLTNENLQNALVDVDSYGNKIIKSGTNIQDLLINLFFKEEYPKNYKSIEGSVSANINVPIIKLSNTNNSVEVGTKITATMSFNGNSVAIITPSIVSGLTNGYVLDSTHFDDNFIEKMPTTGYSNTSSAILTYTVNSGFKSSEKTNDSIITKTLTDKFVNVNFGSVDEGINEITLQAIGQKIEYSFDEIKSVYPKSNIGKINSAITTTKVESLNDETEAPTEKINASITGVRYGFYGIITDDPNIAGQETFEYNSTNIRNLNHLTSAKQFNIKGDNVGRVIIAIPKSWGKEIEKIIDAEQMNTDLWDSSIGYVTTSYDENTNPNGMREIDVEGANGYESTKYNVYTFNPGPSISINQTVTFKK